MWSTVLQTSPLDEDINLHWHLQGHNTEALPNTSCSGHNGANVLLLGAYPHTGVCAKLKGCSDVLQQNDGIHGLSRLQLKNTQATKKASKQTVLPTISYT